MGEGSVSIGKRLEAYTLKRPQEVLIVNAEVDGEADQIVVFRGFSSSLVRPTAFDPDVPVLPEMVAIASIDRLQGPFNPDNPQYLERGLTWEAFESLLNSLGL